MQTLVVVGNDIEIHMLCNCAGRLFYRPCHTEDFKFEISEDLQPPRAESMK